MISLTIDKLSSMTKEDAAALRAIADVYHPAKRNDAMTVDTLRAGIARNHPGALTTLGELNAAAPACKVTSLSSLGDLEPGTLATGRIFPGGGEIGGDGTGVALANFNENDLKIDAAVAENVNERIANNGGLARLGDQFLASVQKTADRLGATAKLHPDDNPATGAPDQHDIADKVFSGGAVLTCENTLGLDASIAALAGAATLDPAQVFSGGGLPNVQAGQTATSATGPAGSTATLISAATASASATSGDAPNVRAAIPTPPPLPVVTPPTLQPQSPAATTVSLPPPPPPALVPGAASAGADITNPVQSNVDAAGLPWDGRIHAGTKTRTAKNMWTRRRGVEDSVVAEVEAQLRAAMAIPAPAAPPAPVLIDNEQAAVSAPVTTFPGLMTFITERIGAATLNQAQVTAAVQAVGLETLNVAMSRPDLIPAIVDELRKVAP